jgi:hypothetical protein
MADVIRIELTVISVVLQIDVRNPFDKVVFRALGVSSIPAKWENNLDLTKQRVVSVFVKFQVAD